MLSQWILFSLLQVSVGPQTTLSASDGTAGDQFGSSVDQCPDRIVVGAELNNVGPGPHGSAYVYDLQGGSWNQTAVLSPSNVPVGYFIPFLFGRSIACDKDRIAVGAPDALTGLGKNGSAYIYQMSGSAWSVEAILDPMDPAITEFGSAVDLEGDRVVVGSADWPGSGAAGTCFVYERQGTLWVQQAKLRPNDSKPGDGFGYSLDLTGDTLVVGAPKANALQPSAGAVYVFERSGGTWTQLHKVVAFDGAPEDLFGFSVAMDGNVLAVGASNADTSNATLGFLLDSGAGYVFRKSGVSWTQEAKLLMPGYWAAQLAGRSIDLDGDALVVGAPDEVFTPGFVHLFKAHAATWEGGLKLTRSGPGWQATSNDDQVGRSVSLRFGRLIAGAPRALVGGQPMGSVFVWSVDLAGGDTPPAYYCSPKLDSEGCLPRIFHTGFPSVSGVQTGSPFEVEVLEIRSSFLIPTPGMLIYSTHGAASVPLAGGSVCLQTPTRRTSVKYSWTSVMAPCLGGFSYDFNKTIADGSDPSLVAGQTVWFQWWYRDLGGVPPNDVGLSAGASATISN